MKKYLSVFYLIAKESLIRIALLWLASFALQSAMCIYKAALVDLTKTPIASIRGICDSAFIPPIFFITFLITSVLLMKTGMQFSSKISYTLRRLLIKEKSIVILQTVYNAMILFLWSILNVVFFFILFSYIEKSFPTDVITSQTVYKAFYDYNFFHNIFAGRDILRAVRNILFVFAAAINYAVFSYLFRRGRKWLGAVLCAGCAMVIFTGGQDMSVLEFDVAFVFVSLILIFSALAATIKKEEQYDG